MYTKVKLGATLFFDSEKEKDIVALVDALREKHKLGGFINNTIKFAYEHKDEFLAEFNDRGEGTSISGSREEFYNKVNHDIKELKDKIDAIYEMAHKMYILTQFNKTIGLEKKSKQLLMADFVAETQMRELCRTLGVSQINTVFASDKLFDIEENADDIVEFIITYYDGIVNEIKGNLNIPSDLDNKLKELNDMVSKLESNKYVSSVKNVENRSIQSSNSMSNNRPVGLARNRAGSEVNNVIEKPVEAPVEADLDGIAGLAGALL